jgi:NitT/TauT family transport system permease protein
LINAGIGSEFFFSRPSEIGKFLYNALRTGSLWVDTGVTLEETLVGFLIGSGLGIAVGLIAARKPVLDAILDPYLGTLNSLPRIALAPLFLLWFGLGITSKIALSISLVFFVVAINARAGALSIPSDYITVARTLGANEWQNFVKIVLPGSVPSIFAGLRLGVVYSLLGVVTGEMIAAKAGLGEQLTYFAGTFQIAGVFGILVILAIIAVALNWSMAFAENRLLRWR